MSTNKEIAKAASVIGFFTLCSRVLGFIRDIIIARLFGVYLYAQAFVIAFRIPNLLRDFVGEGAVNSAFVPVFSEYSARHTKKEFWELANVVLNLLLVVLAAVVILGVTFSPAIVRLIAPGFTASAQKLEVTVRLNRLLFPYILLVSLSAYSMGILNSLRHFSIPALAPCILNISMIIFVLIFREGIKGLALGVLIGGVLQLAVQIPVLYKKGFSLKLFKRFNHPEANRIGRMMLPRMLSSGIYQLNNFVDSIFGSLARIVGEGGVAVLYFSYRLIQFPLGIFSNAISQAMLPALSAQALEDTNEKLRRTIFWGLRAVFFIMIPASVGFMALSKPIIAVLFGGNRFDAYSVDITAKTLFFYSIGLFAYGATKVLHSAFFALKDTLTPARVSFTALIINIILNYIFMFPLKIAGIALATSLSGINTFFILIVILKKRLGDFKTGEILLAFLRILLASICMGFVCYLFSLRLTASHLSGISRALGLIFTIVFGLASYAGFCVIFKVEEIRELWKSLKKKIKPAGND